VRTENLSKQFGTFTVLRSLSLTLAPGESMTIFGRNGAGKTTFLKIIAGLTRTYRGGVYLFGEDLKKSGDALRHRIGFVSHDTLLYQDLTAHENLTFYARLYRIADARSVVQRAIAQMDLEAKASTPVRAFSRGMKQRLSLGRAFLHRPDLLLLDEPFTGLDERAVDTLDDMLGRFRADGGSVLMASHNVERGWKHADRVAVLDRSSIAYETAAADTTHDTFRAQYRDILSH
jgi:heme exporter protein A